MAVTISLRWKTGTIDVAETSRAHLVYVIQGTSDLDTANDALGAQSPDTFGGLPREAWRVTDRASHTKWYGEVTYGTGTAVKTVGDSEFRFDIRSEQIHVTHSRQLIQTQAAPGFTAPNLKGGIGWDGEQFQGTDIPAPVGSFSETHYLSVATVTSAYQDAVFAIASNPVNNATFKGRPAGTVLFLGASGSLQDKTMWQITFSFQYSPNLTGLTVGDITGINKDGWDYLDVLFVPVKDAAAKRVVKVPKAAYVYRLIGRSSFSALGIGT